MSRLPGQIWMVLIAAGVLSLIASFVIGYLYRRALVRHMAGMAPSGSGAQRRPAEIDELRVAGNHAGGYPTSSDNRAAQRRLTWYILAVTALIAVSAAALQWLLLFDLELTPRQLLVQSTAYFWMALPALAVAWRWRRRTLLAALAIYYILFVGFAMSQSTEAQELSAVMKHGAFAIGTPMLIVMLFGFGGVARAIGGWLLPIFILLAAASTAGAEILFQLMETSPGVVEGALRYLSAEAVIVGAVLAPWVLAIIPIVWLSRFVDRLYRRKLFSELAWLMTSFWFVCLTLEVASGMHGAGFLALWMYLPMLWLPVTFYALRSAMAPRSRPPMLLVLRVFQRDREMEALFDAVIERWRLTGNVALIAGTDLVSRTIDPGEIFAFLGGRIDSQFIATVEGIPWRLAAFDLQPDVEGRYRINECYCRDTTWKPTLAALVEMSDVVLTDLRGFQAHNEGCRYELGILARAPNIARVVVLFDGKTDRAVAAQDTAGAPATRFHWMDVTTRGRAGWREVLQALFVELPDASGRDAPSDANAHLADEHLKHAASRIEGAILSHRPANDVQASHTSLGELVGPAGFEPATKGL